MSGTEKRRQSELANIHHRDAVGGRSGRGRAAEGNREHGCVRGEIHAARKSGHKRKQPKAPPETKRLIAKIREMLSEDGLPARYAQEVLKQMWSHPHRVPLQWANSEQLIGVLAVLIGRRKRNAARAAGEGRDRPNNRKRGRSDGPKKVS